MTRIITTLTQIALVAGTIWVVVSIIKDIRKNGLPF